MFSQENAHIFVQAVNAANDGILITDYRVKDNPIVFANDAFTHLTGYRKEEILGRNCRFLQGSDRDQRGLVVLREALRAGSACRVEMRNYKKSGEMFWIDLSIAPIFDSEQRVSHFVSILKDITRQKLLEEALFSQAEQDPLTHLYNRRGFLREARRAILLAKRQKVNLIFVMIDIDDFKKINDSYGHAKGDAVLVEFADILRKVQRKSDIISRYGGDEFMVVMFENENYVLANWASRINFHLSEFNAAHFLDCPFQISYGASQIFHTDFKSLLSTIKEADVAMYSQKATKQLT